MTPEQWSAVAAEMQARWPHREIEDSTLAVWFDDVRELPFEQVRTAVRGISRDGREFCPTGGQIRQKVVELDTERIDHGQAWRMVNAALWHFAPYDWEGFYASLPAPVAEAARRYGFEGQGGYLREDEGMVRAQFREIYKNVVSERKRDQAYAGLPDAGLRSLKRGPHKPAFAEIAEKAKA